MERVTTAPPKAERKPWLAAMLSVLFYQGLAICIFGRPKLGVCWFATIQLLVFAYALTARSPLLPPVLNVGAILILLAGYLFLTFSAVRLARNVRQTYKLEVSNRWYVYVGVFVVGLTISSFLSAAAKGLW